MREKDGVFVQCTSMKYTNVFILKSLNLNKLRYCSGKFNRSFTGKLNHCPGEFMSKTWLV
jgi:hypothetical protein